MSLQIVLFAQASITNDNTSPDPSAMLDIKSVNRGLLLPRMTLAQRDAIPNPANGLMVICTDCGLSGSLDIFLNGAWVGVSVYTCTLAAPVASIQDATSSRIT